MTRNMNGIKLAGIALIVAFAATAQGQTPLGSKFTYQGRLAQDGAAVTATSDLRFSLWTAVAGGTQVGSTINLVATPDEGLFTAELDFGVAAYNGDERWLEIAVRSPAGAGTYTPLTPRQPVNAAPYALQTRGLFVDANERLGIGTIAPQRPLHLLGEGGALALEGITHTYLEFYPDGFAAGRKAYFGFGGAASNSIVLRNQIDGGHLILGTTNGNVGIGMTDAGLPTSKLHVNGSTATSTLDVTTSTTTQTLNVSDEIVLPAGTIRKGGTSPATTDLGLYALASNPLRLVTNSQPMHFFTNSTTGTSVSPATNTAAMTVAANGNVGIGVHLPGAKLDVRGNGADMAITNPAGSVRAILAHNAGQDSGYMQIRNSTNQTIAGLGGNTAGTIFVADAGGQVRAQLTVDANGNGIATSDIVVITGGSDIAEPYDIAPAGDVAAIPGMVVSIDTQRLGGMRVCQTAFDRKVAGIISGANGVRPGLIMSQEGSIADGDMPVAASGRVWCLVDADANGAIEPGDLLTTSATPGHAMRVTEPAQAMGAVIGKAMSALPEGRGYVLVLVSLQ